MAEIDTIITKEAFDEAVPAAKEPNGTIFNRMLPHIKETMNDVLVDLLGDVGTQYIEQNRDSMLAKLLVRYVCLRAFLSHMRNLDLTLTATGFGVVSTNNTAPASKMRVDALDGELRVQMLLTLGKLMTNLYKLSGWYGQGLVIVDSLFTDFKFLTTFAGMESPVAKEWENAAPVIIETERQIRELISDEYMKELITMVCTGSLSDPHAGIVFQIRRIVGQAIRGDMNSVAEFKRRLLNTLESDLATFSTYAGSQAYEVNHFKPYENKKESSAFHFVG